jgi:hypothetical protein
MKNILTVILFCAGFVLNGQTINADKVNIKTNLKLNNVTVNSISNDTTLGSGSTSTLPTEHAVKTFTNNLIDKDTTLGTSKTKAPSQYAVKKYVDENSGGGGNIVGSTYTNSGEVKDSIRTLTIATKDLEPFQSRSFITNVPDTSIIGFNYSLSDIIRDGSYNWNTHPLSFLFTSMTFRGIPSFYKNFTQARIGFKHYYQYRTINLEPNVWEVIDTSLDFSTTAIAIDSAKMKIYYQNNGGFEYGADFSDDIKTKDRSITDVGTVKKIINDRLGIETEYIATLSQSGTSAPTEVSVLRNTLGFPVTWQYSDVGEYILHAEDVDGKPSLFHSKFVCYVTSGGDDNVSPRLFSTFIVPGEEYDLILYNGSNNNNKIDVMCKFWE